MLFQNADDGKILLRKYVSYETTTEYKDGLEELLRHGNEHSFSFRLTMQRYNSFLKRQ
jgi:hypothetical protein